MRGRDSNPRGETPTAPGRRPLSFSTSLSLSFSHGRVVQACILSESAIMINRTSDTVSERLRRWTRNPLGSARRGSNPLGVVFCAMRVSRIVAKASAHELHEYRRFAWRGRTASRASPPYLTWAVGTSYRVMRCAGSTSWHSQQVSDAAGGPHLRGLSCNHHHHHNHQRGDVT